MSDPGFIEHDIGIYDADRPGDVLAAAAHAHCAIPPQPTVPATGDPLGVSDLRDLPTLHAAAAGIVSSTVRVRTDLSRRMQ